VGASVLVAVSGKSWEVLGGLGALLGGLGLVLGHIWEASGGLGAHKIHPACPQGAPNE